MSVNEEILKFSSQEKNFLKNIPFEKLVVNEEDYLCKKVCNFFLKELEEEYKKYRKNINNVKKEFDEYKEELKKQTKEKKEKFTFYPEVLTKKSPITIIDGSWGTGKTFFIELFVKNMALKNIKSDIFKNVIILDVWKYSDSNNPYGEIMLELFKKLRKISDRSKSYLKKFSKAITNTVLIPEINSLFRIEIKKIEKKEIENENFFKNDKTDGEVTIIFFDNLERLGKYAWDVIKGIVKFSKFNNFVIVLPMNVNGLSENVVQNEFPIEKFISFKYFKLINDYSVILKKEKFNEKEINLLNDFFGSNIEEGKVFSIRELEKNFISFNIENKTTKYEKFETIFKKIKKSNDTLENSISKEIDIYFEKLEKLSIEIFSIEDFWDTLEIDFFIRLHITYRKKIFKEEIQEKIIEWRNLVDKIKNEEWLFSNKSSGNEMISLYESFKTSLPMLSKHYEEKFLPNLDYFLKLKETGEKIIKIESELNKDMRKYLLNLHNEKNSDLSSLKRKVCEKIFNKPFDKINNSENNLRKRIRQ